MILGPVFHRELRLMPRRPKIYVARTAYGIAMLVLACTVCLLLTGTQRVRDPGDFARFGSTLFELLATLQLLIFVFFGGILSAAAVAQEKDRHTLDLLLMTKMNNSELVAGKLMSSLLGLFVLLLTAVPILLFGTFFGGVSPQQVAWVTGITIAGVLISGSLGSTFALWREKAFQALAMTMLVLVLWLGLGRLTAMGVFGSTLMGIPSEIVAVVVSPFEAVLFASRPFADLGGGMGALSSGNAVTGLDISPVAFFMGLSVVFCVVLNGVSMLRIRTWNTAHDAERFRREDETWHRPSIWSADNREAPQTIAELEAAQAIGAQGDIVATSEVAVSASAVNRANSKPVSANPDQRTDLSQQNLEGRGVMSSPLAVTPLAAATARVADAGEQRFKPHREVWDNPVLWREIRTWAYGRKILVVRLVFLLLFAAAAFYLGNQVLYGTRLTAEAMAMTLVPLFLISIVLVNAQAVTSITGERDAKSLDLLLVSDLTPKEILWGKLGGIFYNTKEMWGLPLILCVVLGVTGQVAVENAIYMAVDLALLFFFVAVLGVHVGMTYESSSVGTATSLGTVFFLFLGIATCMWMMILFSGSFETQLQSFLAFMIGGGLGLYVALGARNPSPAIGFASFIAPLATFYAIASLLIGHTLSVFLVIAVTYGFATAAMLIPALYEFDVATGRTTISDQ